MLRLFAAVPIPTAIGAGLARRQTGLDGARRSPLETLHVTLRCFSEVAETAAADLDAALAQIPGEGFVFQPRDEHGSRYALERQYPLISR